jgi:hypothetical protein
MSKTFVNPDNHNQIASEYFDNIDAASNVMSRIAAAFSPHENSPRAMNVVVDAGSIFSGTTLVEVAQQVTSTLTAPTTDTNLHGC